jgi:hypothetical protein
MQYGNIWQQDGVVLSEIDEQSWIRSCSSTYRLSR